MPTLLDVLTKRNVTIDSRAVIEGSNTNFHTDIVPENWFPWPDFNYNTLTQIFHRELHSEYRGSPEQMPLQADLTINNEETLEDVLRRFISPVVNYALDVQRGNPHIGRGSRIGGGEVRPDWSAISVLRVADNGLFCNILPGDTKLNAKWWPTMVEEDPSSYTEWQKVVAQVMTYMVMHGSRYGFIITDACLVVLRVTREHTSDGLAQGRPRRDIPVSGHQRGASDVTMGSGNGSGSSYSDNSPLEWDYYGPEYATISWNAHGHGNLTIKLALWCLAMMSANGDGWVDYSYPALDSWRYVKKEGFIHNSSGAMKKRLSGNDKHQDPDPGRASREMAAHESARKTNALPGDEVVEDMPQFSQAASTVGDVIGEHKNDGDGDDDDNGDDTERDHEAETEVGPSNSDSGSRRHTRKWVKIHRRRHSRGLYFVNTHGHKIETKKHDWEKVDGGYELRGRKNVYYTQEFPK